MQGFADVGEPLLNHDNSSHESELQASGTLSYYDIMVLLWYYSFDVDIMIDIMAMIS